MFGRLSITYLLWHQDDFKQKYEGPQIGRSFWAVEFYKFCITIIFNYSCAIIIGNIHNGGYNDIFYKKIGF